MRYVVRDYKNRFAVIDAKTNDIVYEHADRDRCARKARDLNAKALTYPGGVNRRMT